MQTKWITVASLFGVLCAGTAAAAVNTTVLNSASPATTRTDEALKIVDQDASSWSLGPEVNPSEPAAPPAGTVTALAPPSGSTSDHATTESRAVGEQSRPKPLRRPTATRRPSRESAGEHSTNSGSSGGSARRPSDDATERPEGDDHGGSGGSPGTDRSGEPRDD